MEKETLEDAAEKFYPILTSNLICSPKLVRDGFITGAKWQSERMYSDDEVLELLIKCIDILGESNLSEKDSDKKVVEFFNRYKKK